MRISGFIFLTIILAGCSPAPKLPPSSGSFTLSWSGNERVIPALQEKLKADDRNPDLNAALGQAYLQKARETGDPMGAEIQQMMAKAGATFHLMSRRVAVKAAFWCRMV